MSKIWSRTNRYYVLTLMLAVGIWFIVVARNLVGPLVIAALLAYVLNPIVTFVNVRTKLPRRWVIPLVYILSLGLLVALTAIFLPIVPEQTARFFTELQTAVIELEERVSQPLNILGFTIPLEQLTADLNPAIISTDFIRADVLIEVLQATSTNLGWTLVILVVTYTLLQDWHGLREWLLRAAPRDSQSDLRRLYEEIKVVWNRYLYGQLRLAIIIGIITGIASAAIGLPGYLAFGILAALLDFIVTLGPTTLTGIATIVAFFAGSTLLPIPNIWFALIALVVFNLIHGLENVWLRPRIMSHSLHLHPALVFVA
ncbi:MAG: AI-2E family transporter, partial [Anaerolineae bacterium]